MAKLIQIVLDGNDIVALDSNGDIWIGWYNLSTFKYEWRQKKGPLVEEFENPDTPDYER